MPQALRMIQTISCVIGAYIITTTSRGKGEEISQQLRYPCDNAPPLEFALGNDRLSGS